MARPTVSREVLIDRLSAVFREYGYDGASLSRLSEATGLVKASLYYQFPKGKEDMAAAVLGAIQADFERVLAGPFSDRSLPPEKRMRILGEGLSTIYHGGRSFCLVDVFGIGEAGHLFKSHLGGMIVALSKAVTGLLEDAGFSAHEAAAGAEETLIAVQGALVLSRATHDTGAFERVIAGLPKRVQRPD